MSNFSRLTSRKRVTVEASEQERQHQWVVDNVTLQSVIANGEDLGPIIRPAFEQKKPEALIHQLRMFVEKKKLEIEELCKVHYEEFIRAVDELRYVLVDADELKHGLAMQNAEMQEVGQGLLGKLDELIQHNGMKTNLGTALQLLRKCRAVVDLCAKVNESLAADSYYQALKTLDSIERDHLKSIPAKRLKVWVERYIPVCRAHIERKVNHEFSEWLIQIRDVSQGVGRLAISQAASARQREVELGERQRQAEEQTRSGQRAVAYVLEVEDADEDGSAMLKFDLTPVYRAHYISTCLGVQDTFRENYYYNRKQQLQTDLQFTSTGQYLPKAYNDYCSQVAGFFIVEDRIMRTAGGVIKPTQVDILWETANAKMKNVMEELFGSLNNAEHMLDVKNETSLLCAALRRYGFQVGPLLEVLSMMRDKYHDLLLDEARAQVDEAFRSDKLEQMVMRKEYEYSAKVLHFHIQSTDIMPAFPWVAPFSSSVPEVCKIVRGFIDSSVKFLKHTGQVDQYDLVKKYLDKLLTSVVNQGLLRRIQAPDLQVNHAMQLAANMTVLERACSGFFAEHAAKSCGIPSRLVDGAHGALAARDVLRNSQAATYDAMLDIINKKIDEQMLGAEQINWTPLEPPGLMSEYLTDLCIYLETMVETARQLLPEEAFFKVSGGMAKHISDFLVNLLCGEKVKKFNLFGIQGLETDLRVIEGWAEKEDEKCGALEAMDTPAIKSNLAEARQLINLILSTNPEAYMVRSLRDKNYYAVLPDKVLIVCDKYKDVGEGSAGLFGTRNAKHQNKKKGLDALARRLREDIANSATHAHQEPGLSQSFQTFRIT